MLLLATDVKSIWHWQGLKESPDLVEAYVVGECLYWDVWTMPKDPKMKALAREASSKIKALSDAHQSQIAAIYQEFQEQVAVIERSSADSLDGSSVTPPQVRSSNEEP